MYELRPHATSHPRNATASPPAPSASSRPAASLDNPRAISRIERRDGAGRITRQDVAQTEPLPGREPSALEPPTQPITGDTHAHLIAPLAKLANELGFDVEHRSLAGAADGWCDPQAKRIVVNAALPANARVRVLVHEIAHALGIGYADRGRARAEVMVDCVTYVVCGQVGLDTSGETIPYVAGWGQDGALDAIHADAQTIDEVSRRIETVLLDAELTISGGRQQAA